MEVDFMTYKEKENLLKIQNVTATMAIEGMYFNRDFLQKMMQVSRGGADYRRSPARGNKEICQIKHIVIQIQMY